MLKIISNGRVPSKPVQQRPDPDPPTLPPTANPTASPTPNLTAQAILKIENVELRRMFIERLGYETFLQQVGGVVCDRDWDAGGERQLISVPFENDEPFMALRVTCPSTGHIHVLRVPPYMNTCHQAAAWIAGFDHPDDYRPTIET
jgi:hypothetical protein